MEVGLKNRKTKVMHRVHMKESEIIASCNIKMASRWQHNKNLKSVGGMHHSDFFNIIHFNVEMLFLEL